jgi:Tol biopolymer transport system component
MNMPSPLQFLRLTGLSILLLLLTGGESIYAKVNRIAFTNLSRRSDSNIYLVNADGSGQFRLTVNPESDFDPTWSPDGQSIAYVSERNGILDIYRIKVDGSQEVRLTTTRTEEWFPAWSPDGERIAFVSNRDGGRHEIYVMNQDGSNPTRLTYNNAIDVSPTWSPDGKQIAFVSKRDGNYEIYVMNANGSEQKRLTHNSARDYTPAWSPNRHQIAFISDRDDMPGLGSVYVMQRNGSSVRLTDAQSDHSSPTWSADGKRIAYTVKTQSGVNEIYVMNADGSGKTKLLGHLEDSLDNPSWQPLSVRRDR